MAIVKKLKFTKPQLKKFARLFRNARIRARVTQLQVAQAAFDYKISHCKISRVERAAMPNVDAHCLERMANVLSVPRAELIAIDPQFRKRANVVRAATRQGFWDVPAKLLHPV
ncbi:MULTISPECIES: helix-turn-helix domain-containing protein [unclassified Variovorax]|uniref:helix-turn-helix domain-containing protein n=1 Tax=unclassified Variovorax TaxID=663243 RepID=UPI00076D688A|nr:MULTISPECIES: helix-turn-helix transcriptional regulator [unclassified Variovorax]KWT98087.1 hypothetical protein APY03_0758 [Variovorax sp. WDL1]PNG50439.1 hypothetical protein CHC06_06063 [Variovorax sp. B2]PNG51312.1 hypothetical protein CHC07_05969 [Variovorax sp. B4]VTU43293.1 hypothetical protein H6P1_00411 [Variovorax sp. PBL-H6]VTU43305.1 hypothetical protein SRS16P1_00494 [Variovorax sp. SRS16]